MDMLTNSEIFTARMHAGELDPVEVLIARKRHPELLHILAAYNSRISANWRIGDAISYRWIDPEWFDAQILDNMQKLDYTDLLHVSWLRVINPSVKLRLLKYIVASLPYESLAVVKCASLHASRICSLMISIKTYPEIHKLAADLLSKLNIESRIVTTAACYIERLIDADILEEIIQWDLELLPLCNEITGIKHMLPKLPTWLIWQFITLSGIRIDAELIDCLPDHYEILCSKLELLDHSAICHILRAECADKLRELGIDRSTLLDYEQLKSHPKNTSGLETWLQTCNPNSDFHSKILKHKLPALVVKIDWNHYGHLIKLEWLGENQIIETLASGKYLRAERKRLVYIVLKLIENEQLFDKLDPIPLLLTVYQQIPQLTTISVFVALSKKYNSHNYNRRLAESFVPNYIPQYLIELICDLYGNHNVPNQFERVVWNGTDALTLWKTIPPNSGTLQFINGGAYDAGGVSREFHARIGGNMRKLTRIQDGYMMPVKEGELWGSLLRRIVLWDHQSIEIDLHPVICVLLCWGWLLHASEPYSYAAVGALLDRDVLEVLAPATAYRIREACMDPETAIQPCVELSEEIRERYLSDPIITSTICSLIGAARAPLSISPRRLFRMVAGGSSMNVNELFASLEVRVSVVHLHDNDTVEHIKALFLGALRVYVSSALPEQLEEFYRFWFGTIRPNYANEIPVLSIVSTMSFPVAKSHVCVSQLNLPYLPNSSDAQIVTHVRICVDRAVANQKIASQIGMLYQFR